MHTANTTASDLVPADRIQISNVRTIIMIVSFITAVSSRTSTFSNRPYQVLVRLCSRTDSPDTTLVWSAFVAFGATTLVGPWQWRWPDPTAWGLLIAIALLGALAHYALIKALDHADAGAVQPYSYTMLVWAAVLGALVFGDIPDHWTLAGAAIIVCVCRDNCAHDELVCL